MFAVLGRSTDLAHYVRQRFIMSYQGRCGDRSAQDTAKYNTCGIQTNTAYAALLLGFKKRFNRQLLLKQKTRRCNTG